MTEAVRAKSSQPDVDDLVVDGKRQLVAVAKFFWTEFDKWWPGGGQSCGMPMIVRAGEDVLQSVTEPHVRPVPLRHLCGAR